MHAHAADSVRCGRPSGRWPGFSHAGPVNYDRLWERLIEALDEWTEARQVAPGRIEVVLPEKGTDRRHVQIVMTPDEWDDIASVAFGGFEYALDYVKEMLARLSDSEKFAVYTTYDLAPSDTPELTEDPQTLRLRELAREHPEGIGRWIARDPESGEADAYRPDRD